MCRLSFAAAKIDFEDIRMNAYGEEWVKEKACKYVGRRMKLFKCPKRQKKNTTTTRKTLRLHITA